MTKIIFNIPLTTCVSILWLLASITSSPAEGEIGFRAQKVIVFKDGYSLIIKKGAGTTDELGEIHTNEVPDAAVLGSFWATSLDGGLVGMRAGWREETGLVRLHYWEKANWPEIEIEVMPLGPPE